jgi:hypothetical protein
VLWVDRWQPSAVTGSAQQERCLNCGTPTKQPYRVTREFEWRGETYKSPLTFCSERCSTAYERMRMLEGSSYEGEALTVDEPPQDLGEPLPDIRELESACLEDGLLARGLGGRLRITKKGRDLVKLATILDEEVAHEVQEALRTRWLDRQEALVAVVLLARARLPARD